MAALIIFGDAARGPWPKGVREEWPCPPEEQLILSSLNLNVKCGLSPWRLWPRAEEGKWQTETVSSLSRVPHGFHPLLLGTPLLGFAVPSLCLGNIKYWGLQPRRNSQPSFDSVLWHLRQTSHGVAFHFITFPHFFCYIVRALSCSSHSMLQTAFRCG